MPAFLSKKHAVVFACMYHCVSECFMSDSLDRPGYNEIPGAECRLPVKQQMWLDSLSLPSLPTSWQSCHSAGRRMTDRWGGLLCRAGDGWTTVRKREAVTWADTWSHSSMLSKQNSLTAETSQMSTALSHRRCDDDDETLYFCYRCYTTKAGRITWHLKGILRLLDKVPSIITITSEMTSY